MTIGMLGMGSAMGLGAGVSASRGMGTCPQMTSPAEAKTGSSDASTLGAAAGFGALPPGTASQAPSPAGGGGRATAAGEAPSDTASAGGGAQGKGAAPGQAGQQGEMFGKFMDCVRKSLELFGQVFMGGMSMIGNLVSSVAPLAGAAKGMGGG